MYKLLFFITVFALTIAACSEATIPMDRIEEKAKSLLLNYQVVVQHSPSQDVIYLEKR